MLFRHNWEIQTRPTIGKIPLNGSPEDLANTLTGSMSGVIAFNTSPLHFLHLNSGLAFRGPLTFEQRLCTQKPQTWHLIELDPTPLLHTPQGNLLVSTGLGALFAFTVIFFLPTFTRRRPFVSKLVFQTRNFSNNSSSITAVMTKSSA